MWATQWGQNSLDRYNRWVTVTNNSKFDARKVTGAVNALEPATITLDLPPLPLLDHKCSVIDELPKRTLKLVRQHGQ